MRESILHRESALEYFKELVEGAFANQGVSAGELTAWYVVQPARRVPPSVFRPRHRATCAQARQSPGLGWLRAARVAQTDW